MAGGTASHCITKSTCCVSVGLAAGVECLIKDVLQTRTNRFKILTYLVKHNYAQAPRFIIGVRACIEGQFTRQTTSASAPFSSLGGSRRQKYFVCGRIGVFGSRLQYLLLSQPCKQSSFDAKCGFSIVLGSLSASFCQYADTIAFKGFSPNIPLACRCLCQTRRRLNAGSPRADYPAKLVNAPPM